MGAGLVALIIISIALGVTGIIYVSAKIFKWFKKRCDLISNNMLRNCYLLSYSFWISSFVSIFLMIIIRSLQINQLINFEQLALSTIDIVTISVLVFLGLQIPFLVFFSLFRSRFKQDYRIISLQNLYRISHLKSEY